ALAISFTSYAALDSGNGLETSLFMALIAFTLTAFFLARRNRDRGLLVVAGVLLGLSVLTRPEGALLAPALVVYRWVDRGEDETLRGFFADSLVIALPALVVTGLIAAYSLAINGTLGGTASTKMRFSAQNEQSLRLRIAVASIHIGIFAGGVLPLVLLAIVGGNRRETLAFALFWLPVLALHTLLLPGGLEHYYYRYQHPA